jgi:hypothetical protein
MYNFFENELSPLYLEGAIYKEFLLRLIENGDNGALAIHGTSAETLITILKTGQWPTTPIYLPYQEEIAQEYGNNIYYFNPFAHRLETHIPDLRNRFFHNDRKIIADAYDIGSIVRRTKAYAAVNAVRHSFYLDTGIDVGSEIETILSIALNYDRSSIHYVSELCDLLTEEIDDIRDHFLEPRTKDIIEQINNTRLLKRAVFRAARRRGVLLYLGGKILDYALIPPVESDTELMLACKEPLSYSVISGIQVLGYPEQVFLEIRE